MLIGIASIAPGISGGTIAIALGFYWDLIEAISDLLKHFKKFFISAALWYRRFNQYWRAFCGDSIFIYPPYFSHNSPFHRIYRGNSAVYFKNGDFTFRTRTY